MGSISWTTSNPIDHTLNSEWPQEVRNLKNLLLSRVYLNDTQPTARPDSSSFESNDNGSIWIDSNSTPDNIMYILTDYSGPTWVKISVSLTAEIVAVAHTWAAAQEISMSEPVFTLINTDSEDNEGGRQSKFIAKGTQTGDEETTLGYIEFAHSGAADDQKGRCRIVLNDGDDGDAPSKIAIDFDSDGSIDVTNSVCVLDEDAMGSDSAVHLSTQQSIKAYVDAAILARGFGVSTGNDSDTNAMVEDHAYLAGTDGIITAWQTNDGGGSAFTVKGYVGATNNPAGAGTLFASAEGYVTEDRLFISFPVPTGKYFEVVLGEAASTCTIMWHPFGTLIAPIDQD